MVCECGRNLKEIKDSESNDLRRLKCSGNEGCGKKVSIRKNSIFYGQKLRPTTIYKLIFNSFIKNTSIDEAVKKYDVSPQTVMNYYRYARKTIRDKILNDYSYYKLGEQWVLVEREDGKGRDQSNPFCEYSPAVEVDECLLDLTFI